MSGLAQDVEVRLAEIDRRLREIQADLIPGRTPRETRPPEPPEVSEESQPTQPRERRRAPHPSLGTRPAAASTGRSGPLADALARARLRQPEKPPDEPVVAQAAPEPPPAVLPAPPLAGTTDVLGELQSSLLAATRDLLDGYERAVSSATPSGPAHVSLSAGPFSSTQALRAFEQALARISVVRDVTVLGYEGADRAILEVEIEGATPPKPST